MENIQPVLELDMLDYENLPTPPPLDAALLSQIDSNIKGVHWANAHQCVTMIRSILKAYPNYTIDVMGRYGAAINEHLGNGKAQILKNIFKLLKEIFANGKVVEVEPIIGFFMPVLIRKAFNEKGHIKEMSQEVLGIIANNCGYNRTFAVTAELSCDKNNALAELSVKLLGVLIQNIGQGITQLNPETLTIIMKAINCLVQGKRNNMKTSALDIAMFIYSQIGPENFVQLMNFSLNQSEVVAVGQAMETHRTQKGRPAPLAEVLKVRKSQMTEIPDYNNQQWQAQGSFQGYC